MAGSSGAQLCLRPDGSQVFGAGAAAAAGFVLRPTHDECRRARGHCYDRSILRRVRGARAQEVN